MTRSLIAIVGMLLVCQVQVLAAEYYLVVHKSNPIATLSEHEARSIFLGKKATWADGRMIVLYTQEQAPIHEVVVQEVAGKNPSQFNIYWKKAIFTGTGTPPVNLRTDAEVKTAVSGEPRAIGYISAANLDDTVKRVEVR